MLFNVYVGWAGYTVKAQAIFAIINFVQQSPLKLFVLQLVNLALEHRLLDTLADGLTGLCNPAQTTPPFTSFGRDVIADDDEHDYRLRNGK